MPDYLPNKPTVVGSRGSESIPQGYFKNPSGSSGSGVSAGGAGPVNMPVLNNPYQSSVAKNSALGGNRVKSLPAAGNLPGQPPSYQTGAYKYGSGIGGGAFDNNQGIYG